MFPVKLDLLNAQQPAPVRFIAQTVLERTAGVLLGDEEDRIRLSVAKQPFQGLAPGISLAVAKLGERGCSERTLRGPRLSASRGRKDSPSRRPRRRTSDPPMRPHYSGPGP